MKSPPFPAAGGCGTKTRHTCRGVVFSGSSLGTQSLLFRLKQDGALPHISAALGKKVRTNAESLIGVRFPGSPVEFIDRRRGNRFGHSY